MPLVLERVAFFLRRYLSVFLINTSGTATRHAITLARLHYPILLTCSMAGCLTSLVLLGL